MESWVIASKAMGTLFVLVLALGAFVAAAEEPRVSKYDAIGFAVSFAGVAIVSIWLR